MRIVYFVTILCALFFPLEARVGDRKELELCLGPIVYFGGESYYLKRRLETGTRQEGGLCGVRILYERVVPWSFYWGAEGHWARGHLGGHSSRRFPIASEMTDIDAEGRLGYTLRWRRFLIAPFLGIGYFSESNDFKPPTPLVVLVRTHVGYIPVGLVSRFYLTRRLSIGLDYKGLVPFDGQTKICDPELGDTRLNFGERTHFALDIPFRYRLSGRARNLEMLCSLFWSRRSYGRHFSATHDFYETQVTIAGIRLLMGYYF